LIASAVAVTEIDVTLAELERHRKSPLDLLSMPVSFQQPKDRSVTQISLEQVRVAAPVSLDEQLVANVSSLKAEKAAQQIQPRLEEDLEATKAIQDKVDEKTDKETEKTEPEVVQAAGHSCGDKKPASVDPKPKKPAAKFLIEKETDGKWMYCKVDACHFWTRKQVKIDSFYIHRKIDSFLND
jgi:hypothetical protein